MKVAGGGVIPLLLPLLLLPLLPPPADAGCPRLLGERAVLESCVLPSGLALDSDYGDVTDDVTCTACRDVITNDVTAGFVKCREEVWEGELLPCVGQTSVAAVKERPKRFIILIIALIVWAVRSQDTTPPDFDCPADIRTFSDPGQVNKKLTWKEPAYAIDPDNRRSHRVERTSRKGPGWTFSAGETEIWYKAVDRAGNSRACSMTVTVILVECNKVGKLEHGHVSCQPSSPYGDGRIVAGGYCEFGCYEGYRLLGSSSIRCQTSGGWSSPPPRCEPLSCPNPPSTRDTTVDCTKGNRFTSVCTYHCRPGYDVGEGQPRVKVCGDDGEWKGETPYCRDVERPKILGCQFYLLAVAERGEDVAHVTWTEPIVVDNSRDKLYPVLTGSIKPGMRVREDTYHVTYSAKDHAGNFAWPCAMEVVVKVLKCPRLYGMANQDILCPDGLRYGSECSFSCRNYWLPEGANASSCERVTDSKHPYADWFWTMKPRCKPGAGCPRLLPPDDGAVACDRWKGGEFCQLQCRQGTDVPPQLRNALGLNVCGTSLKTWSYTGPTPKCAPVRRARRARAASKLSYFHGDCREPSTQQQIRANFIALLQGSVFQAACLASQCSPENVEVTCGRSRKPRSVGDPSDDPTSNSTDEVDMEVVISFTVVTMSNKSEGDNDTFQEAAEGVRRFLSTLEDNLQEIVPSLQMAAGVGEANSTARTPASLEYGYPAAACPPGFFPSYPQFACVECSRGTYFETYNETCLPCPVGTYQDQPGQTSCVTCPKHSTTLEEESGAPEDCIPLCRPGQWSATGLTPCSPCPLGTFQQGHGAVDCLPCPANMGTAREGAKSQWDCREFDARFPEKDNSTLELKRSLQLDSFQKLTLAFWLLGNADLDVDFLSMIFGTNELRASLTTERLLRIWLNGAFLGDVMDLNRTRWHHVAVTLTTAHASVYVDGVEEVSSVKSNFMNPVRQSSAEVNVSVVLGGEGFWGKMTQLNLWGDSSGTANLTDPPQCGVPLPGNVLPWREFLQGDDKGSFLSLPTACDDTDECADSPCHHGDCHDAKDSFLCTCHPGFTGWLCEVNMDDCAQHLCQHGATCVDGVQSYTCNCTANYTGVFCEQQRVDGGWSEWGAWSECSVTCDEGVRSRSHTCSDPFPENGGLDCEGNVTETESCNVTACPECPEVDVPGNATFSCREEGTLTVCELECHPGFDYDVMPAANYSCGMETGYVWSFENEENPDGKLPNCMAVEPADAVEVEYKATYVNLTCDDVTTEQEAAAAVTSAVQAAIKDIECSRSNRCEIKFLSMTNCAKTVTTSAPQRETTTSQEEAIPRRNETAVPQKEAKAGFALLLSNKPAEVGMDQSAEDLLEAVTTLRAKGRGGLFDLLLRGLHFPLDWDSGRGAGRVTCSPGYVMSVYYCVPCGPGTRWEGGACVMCGRGQYQNTTAQTDCAQCPEGWTTAGHASTDLFDCSVPLVEEEEELKVTVELEDHGFVVGAVLGSCLGLACLPLIVLLIRRGRFRKLRMEGSSGDNSDSPEFEATRVGGQTDNVILLTFARSDPADPGDLCPQHDTSQH